jgi:hypothetical protein
MVEGSSSTTPHVHCLVTGGGVSDDGSHWHPARNGFLVPVRALAKLVRGKLKAACKDAPDACTLGAHSHGRVRCNSSSVGHIFELLLGWNRIDLARGSLLILSGEKLINVVS